MFSNGERKKRVSAPKLFRVIKENFLGKHEILEFVKENCDELLNASQVEMTG